MGRTIRKVIDIEIHSNNMKKGKEFLPGQVIETCHSHPEGTEEGSSTTLFDLPEPVTFIMALLESCHFQGLPSKLTLVEVSFPYFLFPFAILPT
jgi:hypothetical protein